MSLCSDTQKAIVPEKRGSNVDKEFDGTQWKTAQFGLEVIENGDTVKVFLPLALDHKPTGVDMRAKFSGADGARKLVVEFPVNRNEVPQHKAFLEFHPVEHIIPETYQWLDKSMRNPKGTKVTENENQIEPGQAGGYLVMAFVTYGGIGMGVDFDAEYLDREDRQILQYARILSKNFTTSPRDRKQVCLRMMTGWVDYNSEDIESGEREEHQRLQGYVAGFVERSRRMCAMQ